MKILKCILLLASIQISWEKTVKSGVNGVSGISRIAQGISSREHKKLRMARRLFLEDIAPENLDGKAWGVGSGLAGIILTRLDRQKQKEEIEKIKASVERQEHVMHNKERVLTEKLSRIDCKISEFRKKVLDLGSKVDQEILHIKTNVKRQADNIEKGINQTASKQKLNEDA